MRFWALWDSIITVSMQTLLNLSSGSKDIYGSLISKARKNDQKALLVLAVKNLWISFELVGRTG
jgi:hypothetical protein